MNYLKRSLGNAWDFLKGTQAYFRDVLLMHGFILFICLPLLSSTTRFILHRGQLTICLMTIFLQFFSTSWGSTR